MRSRFCLAAVASVVALAFAASPAIAGDANCDYVEIAATNAKDGATGVIDADLKPLEKKLKKAPFTAWNTFKKLSSGTVALAKSKAETLKLAQGSASAMLRDRSPKRVELTVTMDNAAGKRILDAKPAFKAGDWLLLVGTNAKDDGHILGITCR
jgi:hypothetical protein